MPCSTKSARVNPRKYVAVALWHKIQVLRARLAKDSFEEKSLFTSIRKAVAVGDYDAASNLKIEMCAVMEELKSLYHDYKQNIID